VWQVGQVTVSHVDSPADVRGKVVELQTGRPVALLRLAGRRGARAAAAVPSGAVRVEVKSGSMSSVSQLLLAVANVQDVLEDAP
jgi:hypothetical protein